MATFSPNVDAAVANLANESSPVQFVICAFNENNEMDVLEGGEGSGGVSEVCEILESKCQDKVATGSFLVTAIDDRGNTISIRDKYVQFIWVGPKVGIMNKAKVVSQSGAFKEKFFSVTSCSVQVSDVDDLSEKSLERALRSCGGSHQPTSYDFTNRTKRE